WRTGPEGGGELAWSSGIAARAAAADTALSRLVPGPSVTIPWRSDIVLPDGIAEVGRTLSLQIAPGATEEGVEGLVQRWIEDAADADLSRAVDPTDLPRLEVGI